jgi:hypothetical protein
VPFTIAHAAAVLPLLLRRSPSRWFDATCLVAGAMAPDFEYFLHTRMESNVSHTLRGLFVFDVPVALACAVVFHALVKEPIARALPHALLARFAGFLTTSWRPRVHVALVSAFVGAVTHVAWDACTHRTGWVVRILPALETMVGPLPVYRWLQHASTALGLLVIAVVVMRLPVRVVARRVSRGSRAAARRARVVFIAVPAVLALVGAVVRVLIEDSTRVYGHAIVAAISGALIGICVASLLLRERAGHRSSGGS